jgi:hypothetical protein
VIERMEGKTKYLVPSSLGIGLIEGYDKIEFEKSLSKPQLRREVSVVGLELPINDLCSPRRSATWSKFVRVLNRKG